MNTVLFVLSALVAALVAPLTGLNFSVGETPPAQSLAVAAVVFRAATVLAAPVPAPSAGFAAVVNGLPSCAVSPDFTASLCCTRRSSTMRPLATAEAPVQEPQLPSSSPSGMSI
jgi:hypothetical protein